MILRPLHLTHVHPYDLIRPLYYDLGQHTPRRGNSIYSRLPADSTPDGFHIMLDRTVPAWWEIEMFWWKSGSVRREHVPLFLFDMNGQFGFFYSAFLLGSNSKEIRGRFQNWEQKSHCKTMTSNMTQQHLLTFLLLAFVEASLLFIFKCSPLL